MEVSISVVLRLERHASQHALALLTTPLVCLLAMGNHSREALNCLLLLPRVEHIWVESDVGVRLMLSREEHVTRGLLRAVYISRLLHVVTALDPLRLPLRVSFPRGSSCCACLA